MYLLSLIRSNQTYLARISVCRIPAIVGVVYNDARIFYYYYLDTFESFSLQLLKKLRILH